MSLGLMDIHSIRMEYQAVIAEEKAINSELLSLNLKRQHLHENITKLDLVDGVLCKSKDDAFGLLRIIDKTWSIAEGMSRKVKSLDLEQSRVKKCLEILDNIQQLKQCAFEAQKAIEARDLTLGCESIKRYLSFDLELINSIYEKTQVLHDDTAISPLDDNSGLMGPSPISHLQISHGTLTSLLLDEFDLAIDSKNTERIIKAFSLFPMIDRHLLGLDRFSGYISGVVSQSCKNAMKAALESGKSGIYSNLLTQLFEVVAVMIDKQDKLVETHYGSGTMLFVIQRLMRETDIQATLLVNAFLDSHQISRKEGEIKSEKDSEYHKTVQKESSIEPKELDKIISELASICQKIHLFTNFSNLRCEEKITLLNNSHKGKITFQNDILESVSKPSKLKELQQELIAKFVLISDYFVQKSVDKALKIDKPDPNSLITSCVDDVFYILKSCVQRGISASDPDGFCAIINSMGRILELNFMNVLQKKLSQMFANNSDSKESKQQFFTTLNNIDTSCEYMRSLVDYVEKNIVHFDHAGELGKEKIKSCLGTILEYSTTFTGILRTWLENYFNAALKPKVRTLIQSISMDLSYNLDEQQALLSEQNNGFLKKFSRGFSQMMTPIYKNLTNRNASVICSLCIDYFAKEWERICGTLLFNQWGAATLESEVRGVMSILSSNQWAGREKMTRMTQVALVLNTGQVEEILEFWQGSPIQWRLSSQQVKKFLGQR